MRRKIKLKSGFTLVELLVVLVIMAILAAAIIPSMMGFIDKSKESTHLAECRQCVIAAQALGNERYGKTLAEPDISNSADKDEIMKIADVPGDITEMTVADYTVTMLKYQAADGTIVIYENGQYSVGGKGTTTAQNVDKFTEFLNTNKSAIYACGTVDSGALQYSGVNATKIATLLKDNGLDFEALGATSWRFSDKAFFWTTVDVSTLKVGDTIPVMRYNIETGTFTVWENTITTTTTTVNNKQSPKYNILNGNTSKLLSSVKDNKEGKQTYEQMIIDYNEACK